MKYTISASSAENTAPLIVSTEDPNEVIESVRSFDQAHMAALVVDEQGQVVDLSELARTVKRNASGGTQATD